MASATSPRGGDQRRSERYRASLDVDVTIGKAERKTRTVDVSRHGLFLEMDVPPKLRCLVRLAVHLPDGLMQSTAFVSRSVAEDAAPVRGVGLQFFALAAHAKARWDAFILDVSGKRSLPTLAKDKWEGRPPDAATFLIRLKDVNRLREFYDKNIATGGLYMVTPVIKEMGADIALVLIHPSTEAEYILVGTVERVCRSAPKGMEIRLHELSSAEHLAIRRFVETGTGKEETSPPALPARTEFERRATNDTPPHAEARAASSASASAPRSSRETGDISIDIVVDPEALETSPSFGWNDVAHDRMVLDFDLTEGDSRTPTPVDHLHDPEESRPGHRSPSAIARRTGRRSTFDASVSPSAELVCGACKRELGILPIGRPRPPLDIVATWRPFWCVRDVKIISVLRLLPRDDRARAWAKLDDDARAARVPLRDFMNLVDCIDEPRCAACADPLVAHPILDALVAAAERLTGSGPVPVEGAPCPACGQNVLTIALRRS